MSTKKRNRENFIADAIKLHGNKYNYDFVVYTNNKKPVEILCPAHGIFKQKPGMHLLGQGCRTCWYESRRKTTDQFIQEAIKVHGNKYDYSLSDYVSDDTKVKIICHIHGIFEQIPGSHIRLGRGCKECGGSQQKTTDRFIQEAKYVHKNLYDYSKSIYINNKSKLEIICPTHGSFFQLPSNHVKGRNGCPQCSATKQRTTEEFVEIATRTHNNIYDYSYVQYINKYTHVLIQCVKHGIFRQTPHNHLHGNGCPICSLEFKSKLETVWLDSFNIPTMLRQVHRSINGNRYIFDGYDPVSNTVYEFWGDFWHGNPQKYNANDFNQITKKSFGDLYLEMSNKKANIIGAGFGLIEIWESDWLTQLKSNG